MWFQQDGAPAHKARIVKTYLSKRFPNRWIDIASEIQSEFPPKSPDLTLLDFFLWGYVKDIVYTEEPTTRRNIKYHIREACRSIIRNVSILPSSRALHPTKRMCLRTFNTLRCV